MILPEADAKTKTCPIMRVPTDMLLEGVSVVYQHPICIGSACMAWRWAETDQFASQAEAEFRRSGKRLVSITGYCGAAGKP